MIFDRKNKNAASKRPRSFKKGINRSHEKFEHDLEFEKLIDKLNQPESKDETIKLLEQIVGLKPKDSTFLAYRIQYEKELSILKNCLDKESINFSPNKSKCDQSSKILLIAVNGIGDFIFFLPLFHYIAGCPGKKTLIIRNDVFPFVGSFCDSFDSIITIPIKNPDASFDTLVSYSPCITDDFDIAINLYSEEAFVRKIFHMISVQLISFDPYKAAREGKHISDGVLENFGQLSKLCMSAHPDTAYDYSIKINDEVLILVDDFIKRHGIQKYIVVSPHGQNPDSVDSCWDKDIPVNEVEKLVTGLSKVIPVVILGTNLKYREFVCDNKNSFNLIGKTTLIEAGAFMQKAEIFIGVDSGLMHIANALKKDIIGLFGPTDPGWVAPLSPNAKIFSTYHTTKSMADLPYKLIFKSILMALELSV